jgi:hypothetical protein
MTMAFEPASTSSRVGLTHFFDAQRDHDLALHVGTLSHATVRETGTSGSS